MRLRYSNAGEIVCMVIVWAVVLVVLTKWLIPTEAQRIAPFSTTPAVRLVLRHVGCNAPVKAAVVQELTALPWLEEVKVLTKAKSKEEASDKAAYEARSDEPCTAVVTAAVSTWQAADFIQLAVPLQQLGITPKAIEFSGLADFALQATIEHLNCDRCARAAWEALTPLKVSVTYYSTTNQGEIDPAKITSFKWLKSKRLDKAAQTITADVRANSTARVDEMIRALDGAGFRPLSVRIVKQADKA